ncbi:MAG: tandem-95 repeat protein, partial [Bacteroidia bacterium]|nr:tandem-95 repeat protein [Bacteroidia bacterium]
YINSALANDAPIAVDDYDTTAINDPLYTPVIQNDNDPEGGPLTVTILSNPTNGVASVLPNNSTAYTPNNNYIGDDVYQYLLCDDGGKCDTATVFVHIPNDPPIAIFDQVNTLQDVGLSINVVANDNEPNSDTLIATGVGTDAANGATTLGGSVSINPDGTIAYTPPAATAGVDTFYYSVCDGAVPPACDTTYVVITIDPNEQPVALDDMDSTVSAFPTIIDVIANDFDLTGDIDSSSVSVPAGMQPANGTVVVNGDGTVTYISNGGYDGIDTFQYIVCDNATPSLCDTATVTMTVSNNNVPPIAADDAGNVKVNDTLITNVLANDIDPNGNMQNNTLAIVTNPSNGTVTVNIATGEVTYIPNTSYIGPESYQYAICDSAGLCDTATVNINVTPLEDCNSGLDEDLDGFLDCMDPDCQTVTAEPILSSTPFACTGDSGLTYNVAPVPNATNYTWTVPAGTIITSGQGTPSITLTWGPLPGEICVTADVGGCVAATECETFDIAKRQPTCRPIKRLN